MITSLLCVRVLATSWANHGGVTGSSAPDTIKTGDRSLRDREKWLELLRSPFSTSLHSRSPRVAIKTVGARCLHFLFVMNGCPRHKSRKTTFHERSRAYLRDNLKSCSNQRAKIAGSCANVNECRQRSGCGWNVQQLANSIDEGITIHGYLLGSTRVDIRRVDSTGPFSKRANTFLNSPLTSGYAALQAASAAQSANNRFIES
jgi:hypothetical protein